jgi:hypothetical protein
VVNKVATQWLSTLQTKQKKQQTKAKNKQTNKDTHAR